MFTNVIQVIIVAYLNNFIYVSGLCLVTLSFFVHGFISPVPFFPLFPVIVSFCGY